jgi:hypothetical protein
MMKYLYKSIKFPPERWDDIKALSDELSAERGVAVSLPQAILEAVKAYREARAAGTPSIKAQAKGVITK